MQSVLGLPGRFAWAHSRRCSRAYVVESAGGIGSGVRTPGGAEHRRG